MGDVIDLLERIGADAQLRQPSDDQLEQLCASFELGPDMREAILGQAGPQVRALLGVVPLLGVLMPADEEEEGDGERDGDEDPLREGESSLMGSAMRPAATR